ncbi:MAG: hypothetical protein ACRCVT_16670 [Leadbetterella sp.]
MCDFQLKIKGQSLILNILLISLILVGGNLYSQSKQYLVEDADQYFKAGRYFDAYLLYVDLVRNPEFAGDQSLEEKKKNTSSVMFHWKKTEDNFAFRKYELAKTHMRQVLVLNPDDPNKYMLPRISMEYAMELQRYAPSQPSGEGRNKLLAKAVDLYKEALNEGLKDEMVFALIKQCEFSLEKSGYKGVQVPTSYGINYQKEEERKREIKILEEKSKPKETTVSNKL